MTNKRELVKDVYAKVTGNSDLDWVEIRDKHGLEITSDTLRKYGVGIKMASEAGVLDFEKEIKDDYAELFKAKKQFYDQRREYNKLLTSDARKDHIAEELIKAARKLGDTNPLPLNPIHDFRFESGTEAALILSDWHYGITTDNVWNKYDTNIARKRIEKVKEETCLKLERNDVDTLHVFILGDMISGCCHNTIAIANQEDVVDQLMHVSELLAEMIACMSCYVDKVKVYCTYGNHARTAQKLDNSIHSDNLERIIPFWLKVRLENHDGITVIDDNAFEMIGTKICGHGVAAVHGDLDNNKNAEFTLAKIYEKNFGGKMEYLLMGHLHSSSYDEVLGIHKIRASSLCGSDEYAKNKRLFSLPGQTLLIFDDEGLDSIHEIYLNN